jgi:hypothetical protein
MLFSIYLASLITFSSVVHTQQNLPTLPQTVKISAYKVVDNVQSGWLKQDEMGAFSYVDVDKYADATVYQLMGAGSTKAFYVGTRATPPL